MKKINYFYIFYFLSCLFIFLRLEIIFGSDMEAPFTDDFYYYLTTAKNYIESLINEEPDVIICNPRLIIRGEPVDLRSKFNCEVSDYKKNYVKLNTLSYKNNENLNFYYDPYKEISVFIKQG